MDSSKRREILELMKEKKIVIKRVRIENRDTVKEIIRIEEEIFNGKGNINFWLLQALVRYGVVFVLYKDEEILSVAEYMQVLGEKELFLYGCLTIEKERGKGYGKILLKYSEVEIEEMGIERISLTVDPENQVALKMYEKLGYDKKKFLKDEYGIGVDRYQLKKELKK